MTQSYKFKMYPNKQLEEKLNFTLDICRQTYNNLLEEMNSQTKINRRRIQHKIVELKEQYPSLKGVYSKTLQYECYRLFCNLSALRELKKKKKKVGRLRFKGKDWFKTINYNQSGFKFVQKGKNGTLELSKIGIIKIKTHRKVEGKIKHIIIKKSITNWYCVITTDFFQIRKCGENKIGIDLGINNYIVDSEGNYIANPKILSKYSIKLKKSQQNLSRKKKGSKNRIKAKINVAKIHEKISRIRNDFLHKISNKYIKKCKIIIIENLQIKNMMHSFYNSKNIADASWGKFVQYLTYKAESAGCKIIKIDPRDTTKKCNKCGNTQNMPLWIRTYKCNNCGLEIDRDLNSALNIKKIGLERANVENNSSAQQKQELSMKQETVINLN